MTLILFAQPFNTDANGFYFKSKAEYRAVASLTKDSFGIAVEEFEIQFIEGDPIDAELAKAWNLSQANFAAFFDAAETWDDFQKTAFIIAVLECGYDFDPSCVDPTNFDVEFYHASGLKELAEQFVSDGILGDIPERLQFYFDYDAFARDLAADYSETTIAGENIIYRCG